MRVFFGGKDFFCGRCVDFLLGSSYFLKNPRIFWGFFGIWDFLDDRSDHFAWEVKFSSGSTEDVSCFYKKISICFPQNGCINMANMAVIFHGSTYGS